MNNEKIVFETEDGNVEFYILEQTKLCGVNYILVTDDLESEEGEFMILKEVSDDENSTSYEPIESEEETRSLISIFGELLDDIDLEV